jgi:restriction system-associated AAA family ATPase
MRLKHVKILTPFRGLAANSEFRFDNVELLKGRLEPICFVGENGSGKSNLLEVIAEIFYYLDVYIHQEAKPTKNFKSPFGFEISYYLSTNLNDLAGYSTGELGDFSVTELDYPIIDISKEKDELPVIVLSNGKNKRVLPSSDFKKFILPKQVISYSSGHNELISNPFIKSSYHYFDQLTSKKSKELNEELALSKLFHLDYENSQFVTLCNFLFSDFNNVDLIKNAVEVDEIDSFNIIIQFRNYRNNTIEFAQTLQQTIDNLKDCSSAVEETKGAANFHELKLCFIVDEEGEMKRAFQRKFGSSILLYRDLFFLNLMNIHCQGVDTRNKIKNTGSLEDNLSYLVPVPPRDRLVFQVEKIKFRKQGEEEPIKYKNLSDGEHQLMQVLGSIMLLNLSGSILLFDEPETHFNPEWRAKLISMINEATKEKKEGSFRKQEIIVTSHSPFIVSDCRRERVFVFNNGKAENPKIKTFGTSVNILNEEVFGRKESISNLSLDKIEKIKEAGLDTLEQIQAAKEASRVLGESVEKVLLFRELLIRENKIKEDDKNV